MRNGIKGLRHPIKGNPFVSVTSQDFLAWGTHAAVYSKKGMEKLLSYDYYEGAVDLDMWDKASKDDGLVIYVSEKDVVNTTGDESTISPMGRDSGSYYYFSSHEAQ